MKILYIITQSELGGAQKNVLDLACGLKDKYEILVAAGPDGGGDFFRALKENGIKYTQLKYLRRAVKPFSDIAAIFEIRRLIKKEPPDILHLHSSKAGFLGALAAEHTFARRLGQVPSEGRRPAKRDRDGVVARSEEFARGGAPTVVYTVHGAVFEAAFSATVRKFYLWLEKFTARLKDKIICVSQNDKKLWLKYNAAPEEKLTVIHNGVNFAKMEFLPRDEAKKEIIKLLDVRRPDIKRNFGTSDVQIVGTIANLYPEKGLPYFIQAAQIMLKHTQFKNVIFIVIGEGSQRALLEEMIKDRHLEKKFILTGKISYAAKYLRAFDIFVLPSVKEGLPYTILEAMAAGLPVVASRVGGIPEMVENEKNGFLVLPRNPEMLAEKIAELLKKPELVQRFIQNSQIKLQEFSLEKMISQTEQIYKNLL